MKKLTAIALTLGLLSGFASFATADDTQICITKATDTMAKVGKQDSSTTVTVPISFESGVSWDDLRDSYTVSSDEASALLSKKDCITVKSDGGIAVSPKKK